jgi:hypothetical protein
MTYLIAEPQIMAAVGADVEGIGSEINAAHAAAAGPTSRLLAPAADEVSTAITNSSQSPKPSYPTFAISRASFPNPPC